MVSTHFSLMYLCQATPYLLDLLHDRNPEVQRVCDATLQLIGEVSQNIENPMYIVHVCF